MHFFFQNTLNFITLIVNVKQFKKSSDYLKYSFRSLYLEYVNVFKTDKKLESQIAEIEISKQFSVELSEERIQIHPNLCGELLLSLTFYHLSLGLNAV